MDYNTDGQSTEVDGPRTDVNDGTLIDYWDESSSGVACTTTPGGACGQVKSITNALSQVMSFDEYYVDGRLKQMTEPTGLVTVYTYDLRGRLTSTVETPNTGSARTTSYEYDDVGQLDKVTLPNGQYLDYEWTDAHLLDYVTDNLGNKIDYSYDSRGNRTGEDLKDPQGTLKRAMTLTFDARNRLDTLQEGARAATDFDFDPVGNLDASTDPKSQVTDFDHDPLNRMVAMIDAMNGATSPTAYATTFRTN